MTLAHNNKDINKKINHIKESPFEIEKSMAHTGERSYKNMRTRSRRVVPHVVARIDPIDI